MGEDLRADPLLATVPEVDGWKVLEPCVLYAKVGQGGMGAVYRGRVIPEGAIFVRKRLKAPFVGAKGIWLVPSYVEEPG
jgi:hypothetical protein